MNNNIEKWQHKQKIMFKNEILSDREFLTVSGDIYDLFTSS